ncbi:clavaminate synthase-like protein At3g21360 [Pistacia vera]|nr:clavaminate synthase-like protein At3g21360 [Pistacia vera]
MEKEVPEFVSKLETNGFIFKIKTANVNSNAILGTTWKSYLNTEDEVEAKKRKRRCNSVEFNEDGSAEFLYGPLNPIREFEGKRVWFIRIVRHSANKKDTSTSFGDGTPLLTNALETYQNILDEVCVDIKWEKGDVMLLDNLSVQHGRRPAKPPRSAFVSLCK